MHKGHLNRLWRRILNEGDSGPSEKTVMYVINDTFNIPTLLAAPEIRRSKRKRKESDLIIVIYEALCFDVAQGRMNGAPNETRTHSCRFASLACLPLHHETDLIIVNSKCRRYWKSKKKCKYVVHSVRFQTFCTDIQNCRRLLKIQYVIAIHFMRWLTNFYDFNEQLQQQMEYTLLKSDCHSWWISKMQSGREDTLEERYAIKFCFKLGKICQRNVWNDLEHLAWIEHQFLSGIRYSRKAGSLWGMMRGEGRVRKSIDQSWLVKGLGLLCWGFKGVQKEIPLKEASTLQIGSVAFPQGQCTSPQLHPCHRLFDQDGHQDSSSISLSFRRCSSWFVLIP